MSKKWSSITLSIAGVMLLAGVMLFWTDMLHVVFILFLFFLWAANLVILWLLGKDVLADISTIRHGEKHSSICTGISYDNFRKFPMIEVQWEADTVTHYQTFVAVRKLRRFPYPAYIWSWKGRHVLGGYSLLPKLLLFLLLTGGDAAIFADFLEMLLDSFR